MSLIEKKCFIMFPASVEKVLLKTKTLSVKDEITFFVNYGVYGR